MLLITWQGSPAAWVAVDEVRFADSVQVLEVDHPNRRWVACLCVFGQLVLAGDLAAPYSDTRARLFARSALIPDELFFEVAELPDAWIAEYLNVPLQEIGEKREDLRALAVF